MLCGHQEISYALLWQEVDAGERGFCFKLFHLALWLLSCYYLAVWLLQETLWWEEGFQASLLTNKFSELLITLL